ncbi:MAG: hypothetical protein WBQ94_24770 [Terracidiphilus sp.]
MTVAAGIEIVPGGHLESGRSQISVEAHGAMGATGGVHGSLVSASEPGSSSTNWKSVLASLGVKATGQQVQGVSVEESDEGESITQTADGDPAAAHIAASDRIGAGSPQSSAAAVPFNVAKQSVASQPAIKPFLSQPAVRGSLAVSQGPASGGGEIAVRSTEKSSQSPAKLGGVKQSPHSEKVKRPLAISSETATQQMTLSADSISQPVAVPTTKAPETITSPQGSTQSDNSIPEIPVIRGFESAAYATQVLTQMRTWPGAVNRDTSGSRDTGSGRSVEQGQGPQRTVATPQSANSATTDGQEPLLSASVEIQGQHPATQGDIASTFPAHEIPVENHFPHPDSRSFASPKGNQTGGPADVPVSSIGMQSASPNAATEQMAPRVAETASAQALTTGSIAASIQRTARPAGLSAVGGSGGIGNHIIHPQSVPSAPEPLGTSSASAGNAAGNLMTNDSNRNSTEIPTSLEPSSGGTFSALDTGHSPSTPTWIHAGGQRAEAGFQDPALGWVSVRAQTSGGGIHAALVPGSAEAAQTLGGHIPGLSDYLAEHHTPVETLTVASPSSRLSDAGLDGSPNQGMQQGTGHGAEQHAGQDTGQNPTTVGEFSVSSTTQGMRAVSIAAQAGATETPMPHSAGSGSHISVMA